MQENISLESVRNAFKNWRANRRSGESIPNDLLRRAALAAEQFGFTYVGKELGLNGSRLRREIDLLKEERRNCSGTHLQPASVKSSVTFSRVDSLEEEAALPRLVEAAQPCAVLALPNQCRLEILSADALRTALEFMISGGSRT